MADASGRYIKIFLILLVLAGAADGVFVSEDKGRTWTRSVLGLPPSCPGIAFLVTDSLVLAAASLGPNASGIVVLTAYAVGAAE